MALIKLECQIYFQLKPLRAHQEEQLPGIQPKSDQTLLQLDCEVLAFAVPREHHSL
jgi:hypothetical protein